LLRREWWLQTWQRFHQAVASIRWRWWAPQPRFHRLDQADSVAACRDRQWQWEHQAEPCHCLAWRGLAQRPYLKYERCRPLMLAHRRSESLVAHRRDWR